MVDLTLLRSLLSSKIDPVWEHYGTNKLASILVVIYGNDPIIVMTEKTSHLKLHAGEISFPGGKFDPTDSDLLETALRETSEEIGLEVSKDQVIGQLEPVVTLNSGFTILPFISIVDKITSLSANSEVENILHIPLESFLPTDASRVVHVLAAEAGLEAADELVPALRAIGRIVREHRLEAAPDVAEDDAPSRRAELALAAEAVRAAEADGARLLLADVRGALVIPERMRLLLDEQQLGWDEAWARTRAGTASRFGCPCSEPSQPFWTVPFLESEQPRLLEILFEINRRHFDEVGSRWPADGGRRRRLSLFREGEGRRLRLGQLALVGSAHADVAAPWEGPAGELLADFAALLGPALEARATPVFARRFVVEGNPPLAELR